MALVKEVSFILDINFPKTEFFGKVFEENESFISVTESNKFLPLTKYNAIKYRHFWSFVKKNIMQICYIDIGDQTADNFTDPLDEVLFVYLQRELYG